MFSMIDFSDFEMSEKNSNDMIILNLELKDKIQHTFPLLDRCCKSSKGKKMALRYDNIDNLERISCDIPEDEFKEHYVDKRRTIMLTGCQKEWQARNWTIHNLLQRYTSKWPLQWYHGKHEDCFAGYVDGLTIENMMENKVKFKSFTHLAKSLKNKTNDQRFAPCSHFLDLFAELLVGSCCKFQFLIFKILTSKKLYVD